MDYLNEIEKDQINAFLKNLTMKEAVKKVLLSGIYFDGTMTAGNPANPLKNFILGTMTTEHAQSLTQEQRGAKLDAIINAVSVIESGFSKLEEFRKVEVTEKVKNRAV